MKDPLAPASPDPYAFLAVPSDCTPSAAEAAMDAYNQRHPGREMEATEAWDALRDPQKRLPLDVFRYNPADSRSDPVRLSRRLLDEAVAQIALEMQREVAGLDFGPAKALVEVTGLERTEEEH